jgi:hypothetical protein
MVGSIELSEGRRMKKIWILVLVKRGLIEQPELFFSLEMARKRRERLMKDFNPDYDELEIFEKHISL